MLLCPLVPHWEFYDVGLSTGFKNHPEASVRKPHVRLYLPGSVAITMDVCRSVLSLGPAKW